MTIIWALTVDQICASAENLQLIDKNPKPKYREKQLQQNPKCQDINPKIPHSYSINLNKSTQLTTSRAHKKYKNLYKSINIINRQETNKIIISTNKKHY